MFIIIDIRIINKNFYMNQLFRNVSNLVKNTHCICVFFTKQFGKYKISDKRFPPSSKESDGHGSVG